ncbi:kinase [Tsuneonella rigui]|uniref:kinase n=1 Tax=Tsuneonella rigui TaxID=1708790 RepID=UPI000F7D6787|nr:kinase [Tsuneonella rigui]
MTPIAHEKEWAAVDVHVAAAIRKVLAATGRPIAVGLAGAQGSGKSTMAPRIVARLAAAGLRAAVLSLDDFYLTRAERARLAATVHPLLATRGVPGTHDVALLTAVLDGMLRGEDVQIPRFDKATDDRLDGDWRTVVGPFDVVILEGWCIGARPQADGCLAEPINMLERLEDPAGRWRRWVNARLSSDYAALFERLALRVLLRAPSFDVVLRWRTEQERQLPFGGMETPAIKRFIDHYERITRWTLEDEPADLVIDLDPDRTPTVRA